VSAQSPSQPRCPCLVGWLAAAALLVVVPVAAAAPSTPDVTSSVPSPTQAASATFSWTAATPDAGYEIVRYEGGIGNELADFGPATSAVRPLQEGTPTFRVRAVQAAIPITDPTLPPPPEQAATGAFGTVSLVVDHTAPSLSVALSPASPNGSNGWYRSGVRIDWTCSDRGSGIASCPVDETITSQGAGPRRNGQARDRVGLLSPVRTSPAFNLDSVAPGPGAMRTPTPGATVAPEPSFVWGPAPGGDTSGIDRYEVMVRTYQRSSVLLGKGWL